MQTAACWKGRLVVLDEALAVESRAYPQHTDLRLLPNTEIRQIEADLLGGLTGTLFPLYRHRQKRPRTSLGWSAIRAAPCNRDNMRNLEGHQQDR
jgi:hypothetical protein